MAVARWHQEVGVQWRRAEYQCPPTPLHRTSGWELQISPASHCEIPSMNEGLLGTAGAPLAQTLA